MSRGEDLPGQAESPRAVPIREGSIRLGQFLKLADLVQSGAEVKVLMAARSVEVNGEVETRRGRQLRPGDLVVVGEVSAQVVSAQVVSHETQL